MSTLRVGIVGLLLESNTFVRGRTTLDHFKADLLLEGEEIRSKMVGALHEVGGFFEGLAEAEIEAVPIFLARAVPYGPITAEAFQTLVDRMLNGIRSAGSLDGILAAPHGATVAENTPDADGHWLSAVREILGAERPIIATVDPHANLSQQMVDATNAIIAYATNPHLDQKETGIRAARLMARTLRGEVKPTQSAAFPSIAINIQSQNTNQDPLSGLYEAAASMAENTLSHSILLGFPYADVPEMGSSVVVVTDDDGEEGQRIADQVAGALYARRKSYEPLFVRPDRALERVAGMEEGPVVLLDMGDNIGGGAPGDSTALLHECRLARIGPVFSCLCDPSNAKGLSGSVVGMPLFDHPVGDAASSFRADFEVIGIFDGRFQEEEARHGGFQTFDQGKTVLLRTLDGQATVMLTSQRVPPFSLRQLTAFGVDPSAFRVIVAKGVIAPMAAYAPIATGGFLHVDTPGPTRADMRRLIYEHRRKPMFPFESSTWF